MTTRSRQKISSILAVVCIIALLLLLIFLWTAVHNGVFTSGDTNQFNRINISDVNKETTKQPAWSSSSALPSPYENFPSAPSTSSSSSIETINSPSAAATSESIEEAEIDQLVKPSKIHVQPLHADDLLYESKKFDPSADIEGKVPEHRITGQYQNKSSRIWDPHPQYLIDAFGLHLHLILNQDASFIPKNIKITHLWTDSVMRKIEDHKDQDKLHGCFYRGRVRGDEHSAVTVSLCDGMRGHIYTSSGSFFIQPEEEYTIENQNILHKITREKLPLHKKQLSKLRIGETLIDEIINDDVHLIGDLSPTDDSQGDDRPTTLCATDGNKECTTQLPPSESSNANSEPTNSLPISDDEVDLMDFTTEFKSSDNNVSPPFRHDHFDSDITLQHSKRRKRHIAIASPNLIDNNAYTMEVLVAVDRKMQEYHGQNLKAYVLTLMSIVSNIYADASIGNSINVAVVHILLLRDDLHVESNHIGVSASQMLSRFCKFVQQTQFPHDTALLLTREQICRSTNQMKCDTLGLAELGTMCRQSSCAIVQDNGLSAAFTIAHELGHVLSMPHDDDKKCEKFRQEGMNSQNIMSRMLDHNTHPWSWSACSRHYVTEYLEHNHGFCMLDKPSHDMIEPSPHLLAGEKFTANQQCELVFGPNSKVCSYMPPCGRLWCGSDTEGCRTQHMPWADGTECGANYWCQRGKCVPRNRKLLIKVDGGWGEYQPFTECSRPCGGGVQSSTRECNSPPPANGGKYCTGPRIKYQSCNTYDCPPDSVDFRDEQCAAKNNNSYGIPGLGPNVKWVPKYGQSQHDECKLYCRVEKSNNYFLLEDKVKDGTQCSHDSFNKCVNGICRPAGCNNQLDSDATLDKCGVCDGKNDTCMDIVGIFKPHQIEESKRYRKSPLEYYYFVTTIPKGASNVEILQPGFSDDLNYIALMDDQGEYILNGYNVVNQYPRVFPYGGVTFEYTGTNATMERVNTTFARRLKRDLTVEILSRTSRYTVDELIRFSYTMALNETNSHTNFYPYNHNHNQNQNHHTNQVHSGRHAKNRHHHEFYKWEMTDWSECNNLCNGERFRTAACVQADDGRKVTPTQCRHEKPDDEYQVCNTECQLDWEITRSKCSAECGEGVQQVTYRCVQTFKQMDHRKVVDDSFCPRIESNKLYEKCTGACSAATWTYEDYGPCSRSCNGGTQTRTAYCTSHLRGQIIDDQYCGHVPRQDLARACNTHDCPKWQYGDESACSVTCGKGTKTRSAICVQQNQIVNSAECDGQSRPKDIYTECTLEPCYRKSHSPVLYANEIPQKIFKNYNKYSNYNYMRDQGKSYRPSSPLIPSTPVTTLAALTTTTTTTTSPAPSTTTTTTTPQYNVAQPRYDHYDTYKWRTSRWGSCSATCNGGVRVRSVRCINERDNKWVDDRYCTQQKPINITTCGLQRCPMWRTGKWGQCNADCKRHCQVACLDQYGRNNLTNCPLSTKPSNVEACCQFRWRNMWTPVRSARTCGATGTRSRQLACVRLYPRGRDIRPIRRRGPRVDQSYCAHMPKPEFIPKTKDCQRQCTLPKWDVTPWSACSVGCGQGYRSREVKCVINGQLTSEERCRGLLKPVATNRCETTIECEWKPGPWKPCSCSGYTKRRIQCFDKKLNRQSNHCPAIGKPIQKKRCDQPSSCSCKGLQRSQHIYKDGEYYLTVRGRKVPIYCSNMSTANPLEYITLRDYKENYSSYYGKRSRDKDQCMYYDSDQYEDPSIPSGQTFFSKVRIDLHTLQVIVDDYAFAHTIGKRKQPFGTAGDCFSSTQRCPRGAFSISFENTKFRIRPRTRWEAHGMNATHQFVGNGFQPPYQKVTALCGGYCGQCATSKDTGLHLEVI